MNEAAPGDIVIGSGWQHGADGYAGIVVDHGRIVSNSSQGVQDNSSLPEIQRSHPGMIAFRYVGFWNYYRSKPLANAGFNPGEARIPAGQSGGGQWTSGMAPSTIALSGKDSRISSAAETKVPQAAIPPVPRDEAAERMMQIDPPIASDPISEALELLSLASIPSLLKSIPELVAISAKGLIALLRKLAAVAAGKAVKFTEEESGLLAKILSRIKKAPRQSPEIAPEEIAGKTRSDIRGLAKQKGLEPAGDTTSPDYPRKWKDLVTGKERLRLDRGHIESKTGQPYDNPNAASDHVHAYDSNGKKIKANGDPHIPTTGE
jgi:hypothetical protein